MPDPQPRPARKRPGCLAGCGLGCGGLLLAVIIAASWRLSTQMVPDRVYPLPVMPSNNGFYHYVNAGSLLKANGGVEKYYGREWRSLAELPLSRKAAAVHANQVALLELRRGIGLPCRVPPMRSFNDPVPYLADSRSLARLLAAESQVRVARGDFAGAANSCLDAIQMGADLSRGGLLIHALVSIAIQAIVAKPLHGAIPHLSAEGATRVAKRLDNIHRTQPGLADILTEEHIGTIASLQEAMRQVPKQRESSPSDVDDPLAKEYIRLYWRFNKRHILDNLDNYYGALAARARMLVRRRPPPPREPDDIISRIIIPVFSQAEIRYDVQDVRLRLLTIEAALRAYQARTGHLPTSLDVLQLGDTVLDPWSEKPFVYRPSGAGYKLYSVGPDGVDDGGRLVDEKEGLNEASKGDIGSLYYNSKIAALHRKPGRQAK